MRLANKVAIVTGAASGMGAATARRFATEGAAVVVADMLEDEGRAVADGINATGKALFMALNVTDEAGWKTVVADTVRAFGRLDILVNNAGISGSATNDMLDSGLWERVMAVNATGVFLGIAAAVPQMQKNGGGSIVNLSSISGIVGGHNLAAYNASKGGVRLLTKSVALHGARFKPPVRCNSVHPAFLEGAMVDDILAQTGRPEVARGQIARDIPLGRLGQPTEVAELCVYLLSDESAFVTGAEFAIDGGLTAR
jgi:NAD(P)-dependent dehydrogenase (short-subunit alcohol dehydrogenase family)